VAAAHGVAGNRRMSSKLAPSWIYYSCKAGLTMS